MVPLTSPTRTDSPVSTVSPRTSLRATAGVNPDAPVRVEVAMPRDLFDRLLSSRDPAGVSRELADQVARAMLAGGADA